MRERGLSARREGSATLAIPWMAGRRQLGLRSLVVLVAMLAACSASGSDPQRVRQGPEAPSGEAAPTPPETASPADARSDSDGPEVDDPADEADEDSDVSADDDGFTPYDERVYPLSAFIGELKEELFPGWDDEHPMVVIENSTHSCMTGQGFRYAKIDWLAKEAERRSQRPLVSDEEYMSANGYGVADSLDAPEVYRSGIVDPNDAIRDSLSQNELDAWRAQQSQCRAEAERQVTRHGVVHWALWDDLQRLREAVDADPRIAAAFAGWSSCMAAQGHRYADREQIFAYLEGFAEPLRSRLRALGGPDNIDAAYQADLDSLIAIEVEIARADLECRKPLEQVQYEVEVEHQQRYLDENQDRLALLRQELPTMTLPPGVLIY